LSWDISTVRYFVDKGSKNKEITKGIKKVKRKEIGK